MSDELFKLNIDGQDVEVPKSYTLMQACEEAGAEIPRFCYHERLSVAGNCRMCLVEWQGAPKPWASCVQIVGEMRPNRDGTPPVVRTRGDYVEKARSGVMEFLLINHPLDCPICDQGGECDLQDQAMAYGRSGSRFEENKRAVEDKNMGPLVKTIMTRCIQCTRCVRFAAEVAGVEEIGMISRGEDAEITTYLEKSLTSELSGNVIDLCPVGALTSKPYAFNARPWELRKTNSIDVMDALGSSIRIDAKGDAVMRILPRNNDDVNEEWISDKSRFVWDGLGRQRLDTPFVRGEDGRLAPASWDDALRASVQALSGDAAKIGVLAGDLVEVEQLKAALDLARSLGVNNTDCRPVGAAYGADGSRGQYILNAGLAAVEEADALLLVGCNPRLEAAVWNARIRKAWLWNDLPVGVIGDEADLTYAHTHLGETSADLDGVLGSKTDFAKALKTAKKPLIIVGEAALCGEGGAALEAAALNLAKELGAIGEDWVGYGVLHNAAARVGALDIGFTPREGGLDTAQIIGGGLDTIIALGADSVDVPAGAKLIYVGHHGDKGAMRADIILPCGAYSEIDGTFVNTEGRVQRTKPAVGLKGQAKAGWSIFRALSAGVGKPLPYDDLTGLRASLIADHGDVFAGQNYIAPHSEAAHLNAVTLKIGALSDQPLKSPIDDYFTTNPIARASKTLAECSKLRTKLTQDAQYVQRASQG